MNKLYVAGRKPASQPFLPLNLQPCESAMKTILAFLLILTTGLIFAQPPNNFTPGFTSHPPLLPYDGKIPPKLNIDAAYTKAILALGTATNQFHCVSATCLNHLTTFGSSEGEVHYGWTFVFSDTNGNPKNVYVYFDKASTVQVEDPNRTDF